MKLFSSTEPLGITLEELNCDVGSIALPEFGTNFVRQMLMDTRPTTMEELVRISGLSHGTDVWLGNAQDLVLGGIATLSQVVCTRDDIMNYLISIKMEPSKAFKIMESVRKGKGLTEEMEENMREVNTPEWFFSSCIFLILCQDFLIIFCNFKMLFCRMSASRSGMHSFLQEYSYCLRH